MSGVVRIAVAGWGAAGATEDGKAGYINAAGSDGRTYQLVFPPEAIPQIHEFLDQILALVNAELVRRGGQRVVLPARIKKVSQYALASDHLQKVAVIRTIFEDGTSQDTPLPEGQLPAIIEFLQKMLREFGNQPKRPEH